MSVRRIFPAVPTDIREWTRFLSGLFFSRAFTSVLTGCTTSPSGEARYTVSAGIVGLYLPTISGTSNTTSSTITGLPQEVWPLRNQYCVARITDNGSTAFGLVLVTSAGAITLYVGAAAGAFTGSGTKGIAECTITYALD